MKLIDMTVKDYLDLLKSDSPAPGGGSVSALSGAQGLALMLMVADLTLTKEKYQVDHELCQKVKIEGRPIYQSLAEAIDRDTDAYNMVFAAYKLPKETDEEKAARSKAIRQANVVATQVPFEVMNQAYEGLKLVSKLVNHSNSNAASDLGVAASCLETAVKGAWLNVSINLSGVKDPELAKHFEEIGKSIYNESIILANRIVESIRESL
jgi:formiminotetrahydrofolate cyclodeaminase